MPHSTAGFIHTTYVRFAILGNVEGTVLMGAGVDPARPRLRRGIIFINFFSGGGFWDSVYDRTFKTRINLVSYEFPVFKRLILHNESYFS